MATVSGASLNGIYERLNSASAYHPMEAETFADWSMEAGDIVTVSRGSETYQSPLHSTRMVWKGAPQITVSSTGTKQRDAVAKVSQRKYGRSAAGMRNQQGFYSYVDAETSEIYSYIEQTATYIVTHVENEISDVGSEILQTANQIRSEVHAADSQLYSYVDQTATYISSHVDDVSNDLHSEVLQTQSMIHSAVWTANSEIIAYVDMTATSITSHVEDVRNDLHSEVLQTQSMIHSAVWTANSEIVAYVDQTATYILSVVEDTANDIGSDILQTASQIRSEVHAADSQLYTYVDQTATSISQAVANTARGLQSSINQQADRISLVVEGSGSNAHIKAASLVASINDSGSSVKISADHIVLDGQAVASALAAQNIYTLHNITAEGYADIGEGLYVDGNNCSNPITDASVSNGVLTLYYADGTEAVNFSKATSLSGSWSGRKYTVTATPQGNQISVTPYPQPVGSQGGAYVDIYTATATGSGQGYDTHGDASKLYLVKSGLSVYLKSQNSTTSGIEYAQISCSDIYTNGYNSALWNYTTDTSAHTITISKTSDTSTGQTFPSTKAVRATIDYNSSAHTYTAKALFDGTIMESTSSGTEAYTAGTYAGKYSVTLANPTWSSYSGSVPANRTVTISTSGRTNTSGTTANLSSDIALYLTQGSWSSNKLIVYMRQGGTVRAQTEVDASGIYSNGVTAGKNAVTISKGSWSNGRINFNKSEGTANTKGVALSNPGGSWSNGTYSVILNDAYDSSNVVSTGYIVSVSLPSISFFDTTHAPTDITVSGHTNNSDGYQIGTTGSSGTAYIVTKGTITEGGSNRYAYSYLGAAPTALYRKAYGDGYSASLPSDIAIGNGYRSADVSDSTVVSWLNTSTFWNADAFKNNYGYAKFGVSTHGKTKYFYFSFDNRKLSSGGNPAYGEGYTAGVAYGEVVTDFGTTAPSGQTYGSYTNNSDGYYQISTGASGEVAIVVRGRINTHNSTENQFMTDYLKAAPTAVYRKGYSDGAASGSLPVNKIDLDNVIASTSKPEYISDYTSLTELPNAIKNNRNTYIWFRIRAMNNNTTLYTKWYRAASA